MSVEATGIHGSIGGHSITITEDTNLVIRIAGATRNPPIIPTDHTAWTLGGNPATGMIGHSTSGNDRLAAVYWLGDDIPEPGSRAFNSLGSTSGNNSSSWLTATGVQTVKYLAGGISPAGFNNQSFDLSANAETGDLVVLAVLSNDGATFFTSSDATVFGDYPSEARGCGAYRVDGTTISVTDVLNQVTAAVFAFGETPIAPVISDIDSENIRPRSAVITLNTDSLGGSVYLVMDEASLSGIDEDDIVGGFLPDGTTAAAVSESVVVDRNNISIPVELDPDKTYNVAVVQRIGSLDSNILTGEVVTPNVAAGVIIEGIRNPNDDALMDAEGVYLSLWDGRPGDLASSLIDDLIVDIAGGRIEKQIAEVDLTDPYEALIENDNLSIFIRASGQFEEVAEDIE